MNVILFGHLYVILFGNLYWLYYIINVIVTHLPSPVGLIYLGSFWLEINGWEEIDLGYMFWLERNEGDESKITPKSINGEKMFIYNFYLNIILFNITSNKGSTCNFTLQLNIPP
jgi:hypothetical protein